MIDWLLVWLVVGLGFGVCVSLPDFEKFRGLMGLSKIGLKSAASELSEQFSRVVQDVTKSVLCGEEWNFNSNLI